MHEPNLERYCIILVHTLKHLKSAKCVINITYYYEKMHDYVLLHGLIKNLILKTSLADIKI